MKANRLTTAAYVGSRLPNLHYVKWRRKSKELIAFKQQCGHFHVRKDSARNKALYRWVNEQRHYYKLFRQGLSSFITAERIAALENIEFERISSKQCK